jgi:hypothetical protein
VLQAQATKQQVERSTIINKKKEKSAIAPRGNPAVTKIQNLSNVNSKQKVIERDCTI